MISRRCLAVLLFVFAIAPLPAVAFVDPPTIVPEHPDARDELVLMARMGGCHTLIEGPPPRLGRVGHRVDVFAYGTTGLEAYPLCFGDEVGTAKISIGRLPPGTYSVHLWIYNEELPDGVEVGSVAITVAPAFMIPAAGRPAIVLLAALLLVIAWRNRAFALVVVVLAAPRDARAEETLHVLLAANSDSPAPSEIVEGYDFTAGATPPLAGLAVGQPSGSAYLLARRARSRFAQWLAAHPDSARAKLERYLVVTYPSAAQRQQGASALRADEHVEAVYLPSPIAAIEGTGTVALGPRPPTTPYWASQIGRELARKSGNGWALVGVADSGLAASHPAFVAFGGSSYVGGNFLDALSADVGRTGISGCLAAGNCIDFDVDEMQPMPVVAGGACDGDGDGFALPARAGHGTHVAGLIAASPGTQDFAGACPQCGLAVWRVAANACNTITGDVVPGIRPAAVDAAITHLADIGAQVINLSFTRAAITDPAYCSLDPDDSACLALRHAAERGVLLVAAAGNQRGPISFPASDPRVLSVGGVGNDGTLWSHDRDPAPDHLDGCPQPPAVAMVGQECGSNFTTAPNLRQQELVAPAEDVYSTMYPGLAWNVGLGCGDASDGEDGDGWGPCTGTSMAAPIASGVAGLLRSFNPLLDPDEIRAGLAQSTPEARSGKAWSSTLGHGRVDAGAAAQRVLGAVRGGIVRNRATPVFGLHSSEADDHAAVATPQMALALLHADAAWTARGSTIAGYQAWPDGQIVDAPRAIAWVLTTDRRTRSDQPPLQPLFLLQRVRAWPAGCVAGTDGCNALHRDLLLASGVADLEARIADGYELLGHQGFVFARCTPEPQCIPPYAQPLRRQCHPGRDDCAVFLEAERAVFEAQGYVANAAILGHAYANVDTDADTLVDGFESLIGTDFSLADSDGDATADGIEYPAAGLSATDPCAGPRPQCDVPRIFLDDFE